MPATVYVRFDVDAPVTATPRRLHAAWGRVLDLPEGLDPARAAAFPALAHRPPHGLAAPKPYSLGEMVQSDTAFGVELRFLDDRLLDTLDNGVRRENLLTQHPGKLHERLAAVIF